jgi:hypothetical protein
VQDGDPFTVEYLIIEPGEGGAPDHAVSPVAPSPMLSPRTPAPAQVSSLVPSPSPPAQQPVEFMTPRTTDSNLDIDSNEAGVVRYKLIDDLMKDDLMKATRRVETCEVEQAEIHVTSADEPYTFAEAVTNPC